eukprot:9224749-Alexandrium_andersonii.AAC.1
MGTRELTMTRGVQGRAKLSARKTPSASAAVIPPGRGATPGPAGEADEGAEARQQGQRVPRRPTRGRPNEAL